MHAIKRFKTKAISVIFAVAVAAALLIGALTIPRSANAELEVIEDFKPTSLNVSNPHFSSSSGSYPASPSSWTGASLDGGNGRVVSGVVDLSAGAYFGTNSGNEKFKLDGYPEYAAESAKPQTIFGESTPYEGSDEKTLLINTPEGSEVAYAYSSSDMTFAPASFYRLSAWVKTGDFAIDTGATIKLTGLGQNCSFININTVKDLDKQNGIPVLNSDNNYGWVKYTFYVRTSASLSKTVKMVLGIGDAVTGTDEDPDIMPRTANGYAFFDTVEAERISAHDFATETSRFTVTDKSNVYKNSVGTSLAIDLNELTPFTVDGDEIGSFSNETADGWALGWNRNVYYDENSDEYAYSGIAHSVIYNSESIIPDPEVDSNVHGFTKNPRSPNGNADYVDVTNQMFAETTNANILAISTYDGTDFQSAAYGVASPTVPIERFKYYRFGVWVKGDSIDGGDGISVLVKGKMNSAQKVRTLTQYTGLEGDASDNAHFGWKEQVIYIKGSMLTDYNVSFELWLGSPSALSSGIAMFDNVTFTTLTYSQFTEMSGADGGRVYSLDADSTDTGVTNGSFALVGDLENDEVKFPLPVAEWSYLTPDTVVTNGFDKTEVNTENAVHGILPTDSLFDTISQSGAIPGVTNPAPMYAGLERVLLLSSRTPTAFCYQSPSITLSTDKANKLTVDLAVKDVTSGKGAALVLKTTDGDVISTIQNIKDTYGAFKTYTFYLAAPLSDKTVNLEIWLGLNDRTNNADGLSNGTVYVRRVAIDEWTAADSNTATVAQEYEQKLEQYKSDILSATTRDNLDYGVYSFSAPTIDYYDIYSYANGGLGHLYQWSVSTAHDTTISGSFNADDMHEGTVYGGFDKKNLSGNMLYIYNTEKSRTVYTYGNTITLVANMYYRIDVTLKVRVTDEVRTDTTSVGANIKLTSTAAEFTNIKDTTKLASQNNEDSRDYEAFQTYSFYIATGSEGGDVGMEISLGGDNKTSYIQGRLVVGDITMTEIDNLDFENAEKQNSAYITTVTLSEEAETDDSETTEAPSSEIQWWIIPTVIFSVALIAVIIIILVVRLRDHIKRKKKVTYSTEYDRNDVMKDIERLQAQKAKAEKYDEPVEVESDDIEEFEETEEAPSGEKPEETEEAEEAETDEKSDEQATGQAEQPEAKDEQTHQEKQSEQPIKDELDD